jgi:hypothetical protein
MYSEGIEEMHRRVEDILPTHLRIGDPVRIRRSSGQVEYWEIARINGENSRYPIVVSKAQGSEQLEKEISEAEILELNPPYPEGIESVQDFEDSDYFKSLPQDVQDFHRLVYSDHFATDTRTLEKIFYEFCVQPSGGQSGLYSKENYTSNTLEMVSNDLRQRFADYRARQRQVLMDRHGWNSIRNGRLLEHEPIGRIYINASITSINEVVMLLVLELDEKSIAFEIKVPSEVNQESLSRVDSVVLYFNESASQKVKEVLVGVMKEVSETAVTSPVKGPEKPRFSRQVIGSDDLPIEGVAFGEEPSQGEMSFSALRAKLFEDLYRKLLIGEPLTHEGWIASCNHFGVDPSDPAFNAAGDDNRFAPFR